jgi:putative nucleotidyltransferase-like protein
VSIAAERRLILLSAGTVARREASQAQAERLAADVDWQVLAATLRVRKLLTVLGPRIVVLAGAEAAGDFAAEVERALDAARRQSGFLGLVTARLTAMLGETGIACAPLKGPTLAEAIYGDPARRLSNDIDLLVAPDRLWGAVQTVRKLGYGEPSDHVQESGLPLLHFVLAHEQDKLPPVEIHWRVHWYEERFARERLLPPEVEAAGRWRPAPADQLTALLLFYARDGFVDLRMAADIGAWWDACGPELAPGALGETFNSYPALGRVVRAAAHVAEHMVGLPAERVLGQRPRLGPRGRVAARLANPHPRSSQSQLYADMGLVDGLLSPPGGLRDFVRRQVLVAPEVLAQQARHGARARARSRLGHGLGVLVRYGLRIGTLALGPRRA